MNASKRADALAKWSAIAIGFSVPISTALDNILMLLVLIFWLAGAGLKNKWETIKANPVALAALALFGMMVTGCLYGQAAAGEGMNYLGKYLDILFIPIFISMFREERCRAHALTGFMLAMGLTLFLSCLIQTGLFPRNALLQGEVGNAFVFKWQLTQNIFMAFFAYLLAVKARHAEPSPARWLLALAALLAACNVLFMMQGRTGYVVLAALGLYFCFGWLRWKGLALALAAGLIVAVAGYAGVGSLKQRVGKVADEVAAWRKDESSPTSSGQRLDYYTNTLAIIRGNPVIGVGTGGFEKAYAGQARISNSMTVNSNNPHNQYMLIAAQLGVIGLALLLYMFFMHWRMAAHLPITLEQDLARGALLTIAVGSLFNSLLLDHAEGLFYAWAAGVLFAGLPAGRRRNGASR